MKLPRQSRRLLEYAEKEPNKDIPAPELNQAAAGGGLYVSSFSKRCSEVRAYMRAKGGDFILSKDEWVGQQRHTFYKLIPPPTTS